MMTNCRNIFLKLLIITSLFFSNLSGVSQKLLEMFNFHVRKSLCFFFSCRYFCDSFQVQAHRGSIHTFPNPVRPSRVSHHTSSLYLQPLHLPVQTKLRLLSCDQSPLGQCRSVCSSPVAAEAKHRCSSESHNLGLLNRPAVGCYTKVIDESETGNRKHDCAEQGQDTGRLLACVLVEFKGINLYNLRLICQCSSTSN